MVMEYAAGGSLQSILSSAEQKRKLAPSSRLYVAEALVAALEYLHVNNVFHRDVKPGNMCFWDDWENNPKMFLIDFGIASRVAESMSGLALTSCPGTIPYMAEEYLRRLHLRRLCQFSEKCEVFSVGAVFVNLLTGTCQSTHFDHRTVSQEEILSYVDTSAGRWLADTDRSLAALACQCLDKDPNKRPTVSELLRALKKLRALTCSEKFLAPRTTHRIRTYNDLSRPSHTLKQVVALRCVVCGIQRLEGALCAKNHLTCSSGSCLEEVVREQLGLKLFKCPSADCIKHFQPIDFYGKLGADLYGEVLFATDRAAVKADSVGDLKETMQKAIYDIHQKLMQVEQNVRVEIRQSKFDAIDSSLTNVRDSSVNLSLINRNIKNLLAAAEENSRKHARMDKDLRRLIERQNRGELDTESRQREIMERIESLSLTQAGGVALMASGRLQCPRLWLLWPVRSYRGVRSRFTIASEYQLVFLCAHDKSPVRTSVPIKDPKNWLKKAAPLIKLAVFSLRALTTAASGGMPLPYLPDFITGSSFSERMDHLLQEMEILLEPDEIRSLEDWVDGVSDQSSWIAAINAREHEISEEAYASLVAEAYKPTNRGWMDEMEIVHRGGGEFAWVKKANEYAWRLSASGNSHDPNNSWVSTTGSKCIKSLSELHLIEKQIDDEGTIVRIGIGGERISDVSAISLANALTSNSAVASVCLNRNGISSEGAASIAKALETNTTLRNLNMGSNALRDDGAKVLATGLQRNSTVTSLDLSTNSIGPDGGEALSLILRGKNLKALILSSNFIGPIGGAAIFGVLKVNTALAMLDLSNNSLGGDGARALAEALKTNASLIELNIGGNAIGDSGAIGIAKAVKTNSVLTSMVLRDNRIGTVGACALSDALSQNVTLANLDLMENMIGPHGCTALALGIKRNCALSYFNLSFNDIGCVGACSLAGALKKNESLKDLDLEGNSIGSGGAHALMSALATNKIILRLNVKYNDFSDEYATELAGRCKQNGMRFLPKEPVQCALEADPCSVTGCTL
jgi:Ran GTPase-activating protein (RanGAP) involved in mRNA processing and transport